MDIRSTLAVKGYAEARPATVADAHAGDAAIAFARGFADTIAKGEQTAIAAMTGRADPHALVQALAASEFAVEAAVTVRNKVVEAYQEILRMPV